MPIDEEAVLQIPDRVLSEDLRGETVLLNLETGIYHGLDPVGTRAWQLITRHGRLSAVRRVMLEEYRVAEADLSEDLQRLVSELLDAGLLELDRGD